MLATCRYLHHAASWVFLLLLLLGAPVRSVAAQTADLSSFFDSVEHLNNPEQLRGMLSQQAKGGRNPVVLTQKGFIALRLWNVTSQKKHAKVAEQSFKEAIKTEPAYGWAHFGLGLIYSKGPDSKPGTFVLDDVLAAAVGNDARTRAHREFVKAVQGEPPVERAVEDLAENAVAKNQAKILTDARTALEVRTHGGEASGNEWLALGRVRAQLGELDDAAFALDRASAAGINDAASRYLRSTVLLRISGREESGAQLWFAGLDRLTPEMADEYFRDVSALLSDKETAEWARMTLEQRASYLRGLWEMRAGLGGVTVTERLAEHYRRLGLARQRYYRESKFGMPDGVTNELRILPYSMRSDYDDRGLIYIRHGEPSNRVWSAADRATESWVYPSVSGANRMYHFFKVSATHGFSLMHKLPCDPDWVMLRGNYDSRLGKLLSCSVMDILSVSADVRQDAFEGLATDTDRPNFTKELPFFFDLYTFRAENNRTSVVAAVAVPRAKLNLSAVAANPAYRIDLSLILVDTVSRKVVRQDDSVALASQRAIRNDDLFRLHVEVAVPPSKSTVQRVIVSDPSEPGVGQLYGGPFPIPDYSGSKLMLSDIVLAEPSIPGRWHRGEVSLALVPTRHFRGGSFNVFYEIYNIQDNAEFSTEIEIEPMHKGAGDKLKGLFASKNPIRLRFSGVAANAHNGTLQELRRVDAPLPPGNYRIRITVKNSETGETAHNERTFSIPE